MGKGLCTSLGIMALVLPSSVGSSLHINESTSDHVSFLGLSLSLLTSSRVQLRDASG